MKSRQANFLSDQVRVLEKIDTQMIVKTAELIKRTSHSGKRIWVAGNGGSATTASHFATDLSKGCYVETGARYPTICLNESLGITTAWANDFSYRTALANNLRSQAASGDCLIAISGSGNSANIVDLLDTAKNMKISTISFLGFDGGLCKGKADLEIVIESVDMQIVENCHLYLVHAVYKEITM